MAVSCPFGFINNVKHLDGPAGRIYRRYLLGRLRRMAHANASMELISAQIGPSATRRTPCYQR